MDETANTKESTVRRSDDGHMPRSAPERAAETARRSFSSEAYGDSQSTSDNCPKPSGATQSESALPKLSLTDTTRVSSDGASITSITKRADQTVVDAQTWDFSGNRHQSGLNSDGDIYTTTYDKDGNLTHCETWLKSGAYKLLSRNIASGETTAVDRNPDGSGAHFTRNAQGEFLSSGFHSKADVFSGNWGDIGTYTATVGPENSFTDFQIWENNGKKSHTTSLDDGSLYTLRTDTDGSLIYGETVYPNGNVNKVTHDSLGWESQTELKNGDIDWQSWTDNGQFHHAYRSNNQTVFYYRLDKDGNVIPD